MNTIIWHNLLIYRLTLKFSVDIFNVDCSIVIDYTKHSMCWLRSLFYSLMHSEYIQLNPALYIHCHVHLIYPLTLSALTFMKFTHWSCTPQEHMPGTLNHLCDLSWLGITCTYSPAYPHSHAHSLTLTRTYCAHTTLLKDLPVVVADDDDDLHEV